MPALRTLAHARTIASLLIGLAAVAATAASLGVLPASGASSAVVVSMDVPSATQLTNQCTAPAAASFGTILPGSPGTTTTGASVCRFGFASSNATAQLRIRQADGSNTAMARDDAPPTSAINERRPLTSVSVEPGTPSTAWAVDGWGGVSRTTDSGATWTQIFASEPLSVTGTGCGALRVVAASTAWAGCNNGKVARTTTTSSSWSLAGAPPTTRAIVALGSASTTAAVIGTDNGLVFWTTTSGATWTASTGLPVTTAPVQGIDMVDANNGYLLLPSGHRVFRTADGGASWTELTATGYAGTCFGLDAVSTTVAWIACDGGHVERTTSGTAMAALPSTGVWSPLVAVSATSANDAVLAGEDGRIVRTTTAGAPWIDETGVTLADVRSVALAGTNVYAVAWGDLILGSNDTGDTWTVRRSDPLGNTLLDVDMADSQVAWAVGERGRIRRSADGGVTWTTQPSGVGVHLHSVAALSPTTAVAVGDGGTILRTTDSGATWTTPSAGTGVDLLTVAADPSGTTLLAAGLAGIAIRSDDGGASWVGARTAADGNVNLRGSTILGGGAMLLVGDGRTIERSVDGGRTWVDLPTLPLAVGTIVLSVAGSHDGTTLLVGSYGSAGIVRSVDGGATWALAPGSTSADRVSSIEYHGNGVATSLDHNSAMSSGDTFSSTPSYTWVIDHATGYAALDSARTIITGQGGRISYTTAGSPISDYGGGNLWGSAATTSMFGVCLQAVGGAATADWTVDATNTSGTCESLDTDPWRPVTTTPSIAAHTTVIGTSGTADLVWGMRSAASTPPGRYRAKVLVEVLGV